MKHSVTLATVALLTASQVHGQVVRALGPATDQPPALLEAPAPPPPPPQQHPTHRAPERPHAPVPPQPPLARVLPPPVSKPAAFLGVSTAPVDPALGAQLGLPEGFGLVVTAVVPESPAAQAGIQQHDVLKLLDDQQLLDPNQLQALVRSRGKDAQVAITLVRKGAEQKVQVQLVERMMPERRPLDGSAVDILKNTPFMQRLIEETPEKVKHELEAARLKGEEAVQQIKERVQQLQQRQQEFQKRMSEWQRRLQQWQKNPGSEPAPEPPKLDQPLESDPEREPTSSLNEKLNSTSKSHLSLSSPTIWSTGQANVVLRDRNGTLQISHDDGKRVLTITDAKGQTLHSAQINSPEQIMTLPQEIREKLRQVLSDVAGGSGIPGFSVYLDTKVGDEPTELQESFEAPVQEVQAEEGVQ